MEIYLDCYKNSTTKLNHFLFFIGNVDIHIVRIEQNLTESL